MSQRIKRSDNSNNNTERGAMEVSTQQQATQATCQPPINMTATPKRRMVIDFSKLNAYTTKERHTIPDISLTLQNLGNVEVSSKMNLEYDFHQTNISDSDREKTAFPLKNAKYEFVRMPFGCVDDNLKTAENEDILFFEGRN